MLHPLPLPFLHESKKQKELEIYLLWGQWHHKQSKVLGIRELGLK
jgi:hypothetical protein